VLATVAERHLGLGVSLNAEYCWPAEASLVPFRVRFRAPGGRGPPQKRAYAPFLGAWRHARRDGGQHHLPSAQCGCGSVVTEAGLLLLFNGKDELRAHPVSTALPFARGMTMLDLNERVRDAGV